MFNARLWVSLTAANINNPPDTSNAHWRPLAIDLWPETVVQAENFDAQIGRAYLIDTTLGVFVMSLPPSPVDGDKVYQDFESLPEKVEAVVLEVPKEETEDWVRKAADAGIRNVWMHMARDTPEALSLAKERGLHVLTGTCAVMYVKPGFSYHTLHKWVNQLSRTY